MNQSHEQEQQCFIPAMNEEEIQLYDNDEKQYNFHAPSVLPSANEILNKPIPIDMTARTNFLQLKMRSFPEYLDKGDEIVSGCDGESLCRNYIKNQEMQSIKQYFRSYEYKTIYNRISKYFSLNFSEEEMMNRFKRISMYHQYNQKLFKVLNQQEDPKLPLYFDDDYFDSNFECGNLGKVYMKAQGQLRQYYLLLENDVNSHGYTCWFFFKVLNCGIGTVRFHIVNLVKSPSMFKNGMQISIFSVNQWKKQKKGWFKGGENIFAYQSNFPKEFKDNAFYSTLYFQYNFTQQNDEVYFAMSRPYSYTRLTNYIKKNFNDQNQSKDDQQSQIQINIESDEEKSSPNEPLQYKIIKNVFSICSNIIPLIQIWKGTKDRQKRRAIVFMGRQHPAEIVGSYIMEQLMNIFVDKDNKESQIETLLHDYLIVLIPMVNPDGVIHGNSRCNMSGLDLNRNWMPTSLKEKIPETTSIRKYLWNLHQIQGIQYLIDLHGHSKKMGSFLFCNKVASSNNSPSYFPFVVSRLEDRFDFSSCTFKTSADKKNTLRNQLYESGMKNCLTYQNSYFGYRNKSERKICYSRSDFKALAGSLVRGLTFVLLEGTEKDLPFKLNFQKFGINRQSLSVAYAEVQKRERNPKTTRKLSEQLELQSDSEPEQGILNPEQINKIFSVPERQETIKPKRTNTCEKKKLKTKKYQISISKKVQQSQQTIRQSYPLEARYKKTTPTHSNIDDNKFYQSDKKIMQIVPRPKSIKIIKNMEEEKKKTEGKPIFEKKIPNNQLTIKREANKGSKSTNKSRSIASVFSNYPVSEVTVSQLKNQNQKFNQTVTEEIGPKKEKIEAYTIINEKQIKTYLNETLSILKVNGLKPQQQKSERSEEKTQKQIIGKIIKSGMKMKTDTEQISIGKEDLLQSKKIISRNYRKQMLKRKKLLHQKEQLYKFKRFETFKDAHSKEKLQKQGKNQNSLVFYHFPIL